MNRRDPTPAGYDLTGIEVDDAGAFTNVWTDGRRSQPTISIEQAVMYRQRARSIAARLFFKRK